MLAITTFSFLHSFGVDSPGERQLRLVNLDGLAILTAAHWEIAEAAFCVLHEELQKINTKEVSPSDIQTSFPDICRHHSEWLDECVLPALIELFDQGQIPTPYTSRSDFIAFWTELSFVARAKLFIELMSMNPLTVVPEEFEKRVAAIAATAAILCIDSAATAQFLDERLSLATWSIQAARFEGFNRHVVNLMQRFKRGLTSALSERAKLGAAAKHHKHSEAREFVVGEWRAHWEAYGSNKSAFARDYVRRVKNELGVTVTVKTIRDIWLASTRLQADRPASKQPGSD